MSKVETSRIQPVLEALADELACAGAMLLSYERAVTPLVSQSNVAHREVQGFDLALQMLNDLEYLSRVLAAHLPADAVTTSPLDASGLTLERSRHRLDMSAGSDSTNQSSAQNVSVDLF
ncbi:hypothetical protein SLH49_11390 [Cognatiyoonia sp. IB215446]|uniref:hypothetical protein n=1 Tax=Cognatiyoonia sp. IB215446 TaxID=3097355 RepID=UPI002A0CBCE9|nr:hypothetical protein [Cognatiyoonia sp. IB215446]MDX8348590.1 hypothetical protein [Cognatiyoonia sp. IB215446]